LKNQPIENNNLITLYTCKGGKELNEVWSDTFYAWESPNDNPGNYYSFQIDKDLVKLHPDTGSREVMTRKPLDFKLYNPNENNLK
jgi:hypothetical protein